MPYAVGFTELGHSSLKALDKKARREVFQAVLVLAEQPTAGKPLIGSLFGLHSLRVRERYRVVYRIDEDAERVYVELIGERKPGQEDDIYQVARKLLENLQG